MRNAQRLATWASRCMCLLLVGTLAVHLSAFGQEAPMPEPLLLDVSQAEGPVYIVPIEGMIDNALAKYIERAIADAEAGEAAVVVFHVDTFGGLVDAADDIRKTLLNAQVPTVAFIDKNAASAGALISYATDRIVMVPGASIGAATVVQGGSGEAAPDKYQSYMRGLMRSTAEAKGRDPRIAEAMVDETLEVEGVSEAGKVLTLSAQEALNLGVADAILNNQADVIEALGLEETRIVAHQTTWAERVLRFFASPVMQSLLMLMMLGGLYFELQTPGVGFAGAIALVGAAMFFAPHYLLGLVASWELVVFGIGILLILAELFIIPGFGIAGIAGVIMVLGALVFSLIGNIGFDIPSFDMVSGAAGTLAVTLVLLVLLIFSLSQYLPRTQSFNRLVLAPDLSSAIGYTSADTDDTLLGQLGIAVTPLRPSGVVEIDGNRVDVVTAGDYISTGEPVQIVRVRGSRVEVKKVKALNASGETSSA